MNCELTHNRFGTLGDSELKMQMLTGASVWLEDV